MKEEDKELLLKDLCARLPYGVKVQHQHQDYLNEVQTVEHISRKYGEIETESVLGFVDDFKPYLRPMSSMTEEEKKELKSATCPEGTGYFNEQYIICPMSHFCEHISYDFMSDILNWLNAHHFDYRGLIEKNLALDCTGLHIYD